MKTRMTLDEMFRLQEQDKRKPRQPHDDEEHRIQCSCVRWFRLRYPKLAEVLFAIPNGGSRHKAEAGRMKSEGVTAGVADLILLKSNRFYGALCLEMKTPKGRQSDTQKHWQKLVESAGNKYIICRSLDDFIREVTDYLNND